MFYFRSLSLKVYFSSNKLFPLGVAKTKINLLEKRKNSIEHRMNKLKEMEASLNTQLGKKRTRSLIELGGLVSKAQLEEWNANTLLGALLSLKEQEANSIHLDEWTHKGGAIFRAEKIKIPGSIISNAFAKGTES